MQLLAHLAENDPTASKEILFKKWWDKVKNDHHYLLAVGRHAFTNMLNALDRENQSNLSKRKVFDTAATTPSQQEIEIAKNKIVKGSLLSLMLPKIGKPLCKATFKECEIAGGWFGKVAKLGKPGEIVGAKLTNEDLWKI